MDVGDAVSERLARAAVLGLDEERVRFGALYAERAALVIFLRHYGCPACSRAVTSLVPRVAEIDALGIRVACIGNGTVARARAFAARHGLADKALTLLTDPSGEAYEAAALARSLWATLGPQGIYHHALLIGRGHFVTGIQGDLARQGGALLIDTAGRVRFVHRSRGIGDAAPTEALVHAAMRLAADGSELTT